MESRPIGFSASNSPSLTAVYRVDGYSDVTRGVRSPLRGIRFSYDAEKTDALEDATGRCLSIPQGGSLEIYAE